MTIRIPSASRNAAVDAITALAASGSIEIRSGSQPASASDTATGTLLATLTLDGTPFGSGSSGTANLSDTPLSVNGAATGTAGWFRMKGSGGSTVLDGSVGTSGADLNLSSTAVVSGAPVQITSGTLTMPAG
jgi:hypothetical protein